MAADQFVSWLEFKLVEHGVSKVVPDAQVLAAAWRRALRLRAVREAIEATLAGIDGHDAEVPEDLAADVIARIVGTEKSWDDALWDIVRDGTEP